MRKGRRNFLAFLSSLFWELFVNVLVVEILDNVSSLYNPDKCIVIIHHRNEILVHGLFKNLFNGFGDADRFVGPSHIERIDGIFSGPADIVVVPVLDIVEQIALCDNTGILAVGVNQRNNRVAVLLHDIKSLLKCCIGSDIGQFTLWR